MQLLKRQIQRRSFAALVISRTSIIPGATSFCSTRTTTRQFSFRSNNGVASSSSSRSLKNHHGIPSSMAEVNRLFPEELNIIYDSKCNVCKLEIDFLERRDAKLAASATAAAGVSSSSSDTILNGGLKQRKLKMTDIESDNYNPQDPANGGVTYERGMKAIHAVTADGKVISGVPVFASAYELVNLGWIFKFTQWPIFNTVVDWGYDFFAKYRTNITRGSSLEDLVRAYEEKNKILLLKEQEQGQDNCTSCNNLTK